VSSAGRTIAVSTAATGATPEDAAIVALVQPYQDLINAYNNTAIGSTTTPIDTNNAFTQETNGANLQADASVWKLEHEGVDVNVHLSGAMTNRRIADTATPAAPYALKVSDMFSAMPYENSLVVIAMNGPQLKAVLERAYRNYYYYKYVAGYGGYSYYTTCMLDVNAGNQITYNDLYPAAYDPAQSYVVSLEVEGLEVDFTNPNVYYNVSTVNYLAAGACNYSEGGKTLWPLDQIVADTQYYVRDAVIEYLQAQTAPVGPAIEGRLSFIADVDAPTVSITSPTASTYRHSDKLTLDFSATDVGPAGIRSVTADIDGTPVSDNQILDLRALALGSHTLTVTAVDRAGHATTATVAFNVNATVQSLITSVNQYYDEGLIKTKGVRTSLLAKLYIAQLAMNREQIRAARVALTTFIVEVQLQSRNHIDKNAAAVLIADAKWVLMNLK